MDSNLIPEIRKELVTLRRQYFQLIDPAQLRWPNDEHLKTPVVQSWIFNSLFDSNKIAYAPPQLYQLKVLKFLVSELERLIEDPEQDVRHPFS